MNIQSKLYDFILFLSVLMLFSCAKQNAKPNIVFFLVDDLGWSDVGCYGSDFYDTPNIDKLSEEGVKFTNAYAACHVCSPTRASILTGKYPATINLTDWLPGRRDFPFQKLKNTKINQHLPYDVTTLPQVLKENGYKTAIIGKWHLGEDSASTFRQGFDFQLPKWNRGWPKDGYHFPYGMQGLEEGSDGEYLTDRLTDEAIQYIELNREQPFFLYMSHFAVHDPIEGREDLVEKYQEKLKQNKSFDGPSFILEGNPDKGFPLPGVRHDSLLEDDNFNGFQIFADQYVKIKQHQDNIEFAAMVESMDESIGKILDKLAELDLDENTVIIFCSDNGGMSAANFYYPDRTIAEQDLYKAFSTSNLPLRGAKGWLYEGGIRVPMIIKWPNQTLQKVECNVPVTSPDFYPTILEIIGVTVDPGTSDGVSLVPLLKGNNKLEREAIYWHFPHYSNHGMQSPGGAIRIGDYKLLEYYENGSVQLFNLKNDIGEQMDLSKIEIEKTRELKEKLHKWLEESGAKMMEFNPEYNPSSNID